MSTLLSSPRRRRRLAWTLGIALPLAAVAAIAIIYSNTGEQVADTPLSTVTTETTTVPPIRVTPAVRAQVDGTVQEFVRTAVIRRDLDQAWPLASPVMRRSVTHADWTRGDIPVQPFPAAALASADWRLRYRFERTVGIDVMVQPKQGSGAPVAVYAVELSAPGSGAPSRFLVDSWVAQTTLGGDAGSPQPPAGTRTEAEPQAAFDQGKLGAEWLLVPAGIVVLLLLVLGGFVVRNVLRARRAERAYREQFPR